MEIIQIETFPNGGRPPIQSWLKDTPPEGYALIQCDTTVFYEYRGFVELTLSGNICTGMIGNQLALDEYLLEHPDKPEEPPAPTMDERITELEKENARLKAQNELQAQQQTFLEDCILEMGNVVYA